MTQLTLEEYFVLGNNLDQSKNFKVPKDIHPFVKWAGGKGQLLPELDKMIPSQFNRYFEPFLGGGATFFYMMSRGIRLSNACLSDSNHELVTTYNTIRDYPKGVIELLQKCEDEYKAYPPLSKEQKVYYYRLRDARNNNMQII